MGEYTVVRGDSRMELVERVDLRMQDGWMPQGGVAVVCRPGVEFYQAMVRPATPAKGESHD